MTRKWLTLELTKPKATKLGQTRRISMKRMLKVLARETGLRQLLIEIAFLSR